MRPTVAIEWRTQCFECGTEHSEEYHVDQGTPFAAPNYRKCPNCREPLEYYNHAQEYRLTEVLWP